MMTVDVKFKATKFEVQKIHIDDKQELAICMSGVYDELYKNFLYSMLRGKIDFKKSLKKGFFRNYQI